MNRAERRRAKRTAEKPKTYVLTQDQIDQMKAEATAEAFKMLLSIPVIVLHDKFGFGRIRLDRFIHYALGWATDVQNGVVTLKEVMDLCEDEIGLKIMEK